MATSGVINGTLMAIYINGVKIAKMLSNSVSIQRPTREVANKDSGDWVSKKPNRASWNFNGSAHFEFVTANGYDDLKTAIKNSTQLWVMTSSEVAGDTLQVGSAYITQLDADFPDMDNSSYTVNIDGDGELFDSPVT